MKPSNWSSIVYTVEDDKLKPPHRTALLHVPSNYSHSAIPLIVALHGKEQSPANFEDHTELSKEELNPDAIVVYPEGVNLEWLGDPDVPSRKDRDDIAFILVLLDHLQRDYNIDSDRIYGVGFSNGGGLADLLASDHDASAHFAAFAISSGAFYKEPPMKEPLFSHINPHRTPIPIMEFHGDKDPVIHYDGKSTPDGETYSPPDLLEMWAKKNECKPEPSRTKLYDDKVSRYGWTTESGEEVLVHYLIAGYGHGWPTKRPLDNDDQRHGPTYFDATPIVLDWFRKFRKPAA